MALAELDSLKQLIDQKDALLAHKDVLLAAVASRPFTVSVPPGSITVATTRDWFDALSLAGTLLVSPFIALLAAQHGAVQGAKGAREAALTVQKEQAADARRLRAEDSAEADRRALVLLLRRLNRDVIIMEGIATSLHVTERIAPSMPVATDTLRTIWEVFVARRDAVMLLDHVDLEHEIDHFYEFAFSRSGFMPLWLAKEEGLLSAANPDYEQIVANARMAEHEFRRKLDRIAPFIPRMEERAKELASAALAGQSGAVSPPGGASGKG